MLGRVRLAQAGARAVGKASHVLQLMVDYAAQRKQLDKPIADFQLMQKMLADSVTEINSARLMVLHAAWIIDQRQSAGRRDFGPRHRSGGAGVWRYGFLQGSADRALLPRRSHLPYL